MHPGPLPLPGLGCPPRCSCLGLPGRRAPGRAGRASASGRRRLPPPRAGVLLRRRPLLLPPSRRAGRSSQRAARTQVPAPGSRRIVSDRDRVGPGAGEGARGGAETGPRPSPRRGSAAALPRPSRPHALCGADPAGPAGPRAPQGRCPHALCVAMVTLTSAASVSSSFGERVGLR